MLIHGMCGAELLPMEGRGWLSVLGLATAVREFNDSEVVCLI